MSFYHGPTVVTNGLILSLDAADKNSYPGSGTTWRDMSGNNRTGTLTNGPTFSSANGGNIVFDGTNDYVDFGTTDLSITRDFTISFWINGFGSGNRDVFNKGYGSPYGLYIIKTTAGNLSSQASLTSGFYQVDTTATSFTGINHFSFVRNNTNGAWYINGAAENSATISGNNISQDASKTWRFGGNFDFVIGAFSGNLYNFMIYNVPLTALQVLQNYNATKSRFGLT